jgi:hypothetical protein
MGLLLILSTLLEQPRVLPHYDSLFKILLYLHIQPNLS